MARPRSDDPRTELIRLRVTPSEKARIGSSAAAADSSVADFVRGRALGVEQARVDTRWSATAASTDTGTTPSATGTVTPRGASRPAPAESRRLNRCPRFDQCGFEAASANARCAVHGLKVWAPR